jgi:MoaA/NifB/PqqE/SkfB family radical SAM enzyme
MVKPSVELWLELETRCNLRCLFCYNYWKDGRTPEPSRHETTETIRALRRLLDVVDCKQLAYSGGEPLLRRDLVHILASIRHYQIPTILTTNGTLLTREKIDELTSVGVTGFQIPLHSHEEDVHDRLSAGRCWQSALRAMVRVRESGSSVVPVFVATRWNLSHFPLVLDICAQLGIRRIIFNRFVPSGLGSVNRDQIGLPSETDLLTVLSEADRRAVADGMTIHLGVPVSAPLSVQARWQAIELDSCPVGAGQRRWTIGSDLSIRRCNQSGLSIGNLMDHGIEKLLEELNSNVTSKTNKGGEIRPCQILESTKLVQIQAPVPAHSVFV